MSTPIPESTRAWLQQAAAAGLAEPLVLQHLLERVDALEDDATEQSQSTSFCNEAIVRRLEALEALEAAKNLRQQDEDAELAAPTPEAARVATDEELFSVAELERFPIHAYRACYNRGRQHGAAHAPDALPAVPVAWGNFREDGTCVGLTERFEDTTRWLNPRPLFLSSQWTPAAPLAPGDATASDSKMSAYKNRVSARFAILDRLEKDIDFTSHGWRLTPEGEQWRQLMAEQGQDEQEMGL